MVTRRGIIVVTRRSMQLEEPDIKIHMYAHIFMISFRFGLIYANVNADYPYNVQVKSRISLSYHS